VATIAWLVFLTCFQAKTTERNEILFEEKKALIVVLLHICLSPFTSKKPQKVLKNISKAGK
jgi:lysophospholipid acyltransferase (LPLAT)-like uncharacterized protein